MAGPRRWSVLATLFAGAVQAKVFHAVVAKDGSGDHTTITQAIASVPDNGADRWRIFVKKGVYVERVLLGPTKKNVSLVGENPDSVVIRYDYHSGTNDDGTVVSGYQGTTVFTVQGSDFFAENITFQNSAGNKGVALAISTEADRTITRRCRFIGYQDTYRAHKFRQYHADCLVEGGVDFVYADGQVLFDRCVLRTISPGSVIAAPGEARQKKTVAGSEVLLGFLFNECKLEVGSGMGSKKVALGRMWGPQYPAAVYSRCTMGSEIAEEGWGLMTTGAEKTSFVGEYQSQRGDGSLVDVSKRISWARQISKEQYERIFNPDSFFVGSTGSWGATGWSPRKSIQDLSAPKGLASGGNELVWQAVASAVGYVVYRNGSAVGIVEVPRFTGTLQKGDLFAVRAVSAGGWLGAPGSFVVGTSGVGIGTLISKGANLRLEAPLEEGSVLVIRDLSGRVVAIREGKGSAWIETGRLGMGMFHAAVHRGSSPIAEYQLLRIE